MFLEHSGNKQDFLKVQGSWFTRVSCRKFFAMLYYGFETSNVQNMKI